MHADKGLVEDCCGWNRKLWADAVKFAVSQLPERLDQKTVLEIGAGPYSSLSPIFVGTGARVFCSYYGQSRDRIENGQLKIVRERHKLPRIPLFEVNIDRVQGLYDVIVLKSVLGGMSRSNDYARARSIIDKLLQKNIRRAGYLISIDNGHVNMFTKLRTQFGAGKNGWTFFKREQLLSALADYDVQIAGFGFFNVGSARFIVGDKAEFLNDLIYRIDKLVLRFADMKDRAVLTTIIRKS
jgi:hypothetical protein